MVPTRPSSISKPNIEAFRAKGASVVPIEISSATHDQLKELMKGADTVISVLVYTQLQLQRKLVDAAKEAGIKRFIPCDFGTTGKRGWRELYDEVCFWVSHRRFLYRCSDNQHASEIGHQGLRERVGHRLHFRRCWLLVSPPSYCSSPKHLKVSKADQFPLAAPQVSSKPSYDIPQTNSLSFCIRTLSLLLW